MDYEDYEDLVYSKLLWDETYTEDEITAYEKHLGDSLPEDFRYYLLNVSKEIFGCDYPEIVDGLTPKENNKSTCLKKYEQRRYPNGLPLLQCRVCGNDFNELCTIGEFGIPQSLDHWYWGPLWKNCQICNSEMSNASCTKCNISPGGGTIWVSNGGCNNVHKIVLRGPIRVLYGLHMIIFIIISHNICSKDHIYMKSDNPDSSSK